MQKIINRNDWRKVSGIYCIKNILNDKTYIGSSKDIFDRLRIHERDLNSNKHHSIHLQNSWNKFGKEVFEYYCVEKTEIQFLIEREQHWMNIYEPYIKDKGYNISPTAGSCTGIKLSEEHKQKIRIAHKGKIIPEHVRQKISKTNKENPYWKGKNHSDETKEKISQIKMGHKQSELVCKKKKNDSIRKSGVRTGSFKGVYWCKTKKKWAAQIRFNTRFFLGYFTDDVEAAHNYDYYTLKFFGDGFLNFPEFDYTNFVPKKEIKI